MSAVISKMAFAVGTLFGYKPKNIDEGFVINTGSPDLAKITYKNKAISIYTDNELNTPLENCDSQNIAFGHRNHPLHGFWHTESASGSNSELPHDLASHYHILPTSNDDAVDISFIECIIENSDYLTDRQKKYTLGQLRYHLRKSESNGTVYDEYTCLNEKATNALYISAITTFVDGLIDSNLKLFASLSDGQRKLLKFSFNVILLAFLGESILAVGGMACVKLLLESILEKLGVAKEISSLLTNLMVSASAVFLDPSYGLEVFMVTTGAVWGWNVGRQLANACHSLLPNSFYVNNDSVDAERLNQQIR